MGIKGLNTWISTTFPGVMQATQEGKGGGKGGKGKGGGKGGGAPTPYDHVLFDANGIVHQACRKRPNEREVIRSIVQELDSLLRAFPPRMSVLIALDGPGPTAKLLEQRKRRIDRVLKSARDAEAAIPGSAEAIRREELALFEGRPPPSQKKPRRKGFDSLQVTPGTLFMLRLREALEWYAASRVAGEMSVLQPGGGAAPPPLIFVSGADVPGEGELKLLQHLHAAQHWAAEAAEHHQSQPGGGAGHQHVVGAPPPSFLLVGPDADLLLLGLAAGVRNCDVLTTDANNNRKLFRVAPLCEAFERQLSLKGTPPSSQAAGGGPDGRVGFGNLHQLDFLVVAFLQGNDYLPKLRGAQLPRMWSRLASLLRSGEFAGQHLLRPTAEGVEIHLRLLVRLAGGSCDAAGPDSEDLDEPMDLDEDPDEDEEEGDEEDDAGGQGGYGTATRGAALAPFTSAADGSVGSGRKRAREPSPRYDVEAYLRCVGWCAAMYLSGICPDFGVAYTARAAPTAAQLARWLQAQEAEAKAGELLPSIVLKGALQLLSNRSK